MKILALHSIYGDDENKKSAVDLWRIYRPLKELEKHVDWQIDHQPTLIPNIEKYKDKREFTPFEMSAAFRKLCEYDIVFSSYRSDLTAYTMLKVARDRAGVKYIMDTDDNMFAVNPDNPFWVKMDDEKCYYMQRMIRDNDYMCTTNERLAEVFRTRREHSKDSTYVIPNYITDEYKHASFDNGDDVVIGYFGGSSHYGDLHRTHVLEAVKKIMIENKNVRFKAIGMPVETYLPRKRYEFVDGKRGSGWINELYPSMNIDIAIGPLEKNIFNDGKSNIKWQEATRANSVFVATDFGPYSDLKNVASLVDNTSDSWYKALKRLVDDKVYRKSLLERAQKELENNWRLEDNWIKYKEMFERVNNEGNTVKK